MRLRYKANFVAFATIVLLIFAVTPRAATAQTTGLGALHGQVLDPSGGAVVGASVVLTTPTGDTLVATTRSARRLRPERPGPRKIFSSGHRERFRNF